MPQNGSNKTRFLEESGLSSTIYLYLNAICDGYFKPQEEGLSYLRRLFFSFSGSLIFLHVTLIETGFKTLEIWRLLPNRHLKATLPIQLPSKQFFQIMIYYLYVRAWHSLCLDSCNRNRFWVLKTWYGPLLYFWSNSAGFHTDRGAICFDNSMGN